MAALKHLLPVALLVTSCVSFADRDDPRHQGRTATSWIEELGRQSVAPKLGGFFRQTGTKPSLDALQAIGPAAVPACIRALGRNDSSVRIGAARAIELYGPSAAAAVPALVKAMVEPPAIPVQAAAALETIGDTAVPALNLHLTHDEPMVRLSVAHALVRIDSIRDDAFKVLVDGLQFLDVPFRDAVGGWGSRQQRYEEVMMVEMPGGKRLHNREGGIRAMAAQLIGTLGPAAVPAVPALIAVLKNQRYPDAPEAAAGALGNIGSAARPAVPALLETLASLQKKGGRQRLLYASAFALGKIGVASTDLPELYRMLATVEASGTEYSSVVRALAGAPDEAVADLITLVSSPDSVTALRAAYALAAMGPRAQAARPALTAALRHRAPGVRAAAASALGDIGVGGDADALVALRDLIDDPDQAARSAAQSVLFKLDPKSPGVPAETPSP